MNAETSRRGREREWLIAVGLPAATAAGAALLEFGDKLPEWAKSPGVLCTAMVCATLLLVGFQISRGLSKLGAIVPAPRPPAEPDEG